MQESNETMLSNLAQILAVQFPLPGQPGAPSFDGKDISNFLRNWERFTGKYRYTDDRKIADLADYCSTSIGAYIETLIKVAKAEATVTATASTMGTAEDATINYRMLWSALRKLLLMKFRKEDSEQHRIAIPFLCALVKYKGFHNDAGFVERYLYQFKEISSTLVNDGMLTRFDQVVLFLQELLEGIAAKIYTIAKLDVDGPSSFVKTGCFDEAVETALAMNRTTTGIDRLQTLGIDQHETLSRPCARS
jgi:hypothetical protein